MLYRSEPFNVRGSPHTVVSITHTFQKIGLHRSWLAQNSTHSETVFW